MADIKVSIKNASSALSDAEVEAILPALQTQVSRDFAPPWGVPADLDFVPTNEDPPAGHWWLIMLDDSDQAGDLGYHDITAEGLPMGKVFAKTDINAKASWTVTASHELLEMLVDPSINLNALVQSSFSTTENVVTRLYAYEVADPCEADPYGYLIDNVLVSDFVFPAWFEPFRSPAARFDFQNLIRAPFQLLPGGYESVYDISSGTGWQQITMPLNEGAGMRGARAPIGSRRERRRTPKSQWMVSSPKPSR